MLIASLTGYDVCQGNISSNTRGCSRQKVPGLGQLAMHDSLGHMVQAGSRFHEDFWDDEFEVCVLRSVCMPVPAS